MKKVVQPLSRLCGLETEHAMHCDQSFAIPLLPGKREFTHAQHYEAIMDQLQAQSPSAPPKGDKQGAFFANGSAVWYEAILPGVANGLLESCTPECDSPKQLLASSRAVDALLLNATGHLEQVKLIKNCGDTRNNVYGAQENYEVQSFDDSDATKWRWKIRALKAVTVFNFFLMCFTSILPVSIALGVAKAAGYPAGIASLLFPWAVLCLVKRKWIDLAELLNVWLAILLMPKTIAVSLFYRSTKIGKTYKHLTPFLVSRIIYAGAGAIDQKGNFHLGQKASSRTTDWLMMNVGFQQSIFCLNGIFKDLFKWMTRSKTDFYSGRRRISFAIGDSNMCEEAEYLKIATTSLTLDAIESGAITDFPRLKGTIRSLRKLNSDPTLKATVKTSRGEMTAIEIQQFYLNACRKYVESLESAPEEAFEILQRWSDVLFNLVNSPEELFGRVDWVTKRALMRRVHQSDANPQRIGSHSEFSNSRQLLALKKVDTKYHEVSNEGYYYQLRNNGLTTPVLDDQEITKAGRMPPLSSTAAQRSRYIREFGREVEWVTWDMVKLANERQPVEFSRNE